MNLIHILIDLENVKPTASEMRLVSGPQYRLWLFRGPHQNKFDAEIVEQLQPLGDRVKHIRSDKSGKNALDFHIAFYLGCMIPGLEIAVAPGEKSASFFIISKDSGFDALLGHIRELGYSAARMASVREARGVDAATDVADTPEPAAKMAVPKKVVAAKPVASAKRTPTPAAQPAKPKAKPAAPQPKKIAKPDPWSRAIENLRDHPNNRPTTSKTLERHLATLLGKEASQQLVKDLIARLTREGIAVANSKKIGYKIPDGKK